VYCRWSHGFIAPRPLYTGLLCPTCWNSFLPSSPKALRTHRRERPLLARKGNWREFSQQFAAENGIFYMPQSWDMGQIILLPLRRKACWGFFHIVKNPTVSVGIEPANSGTRGQHANHQTTEAIKCILYYCHRVSTQLQLTNIKYHHIKEFLFKWPTRRTIYPNLFCYKTLYVSGIFSAHHQEFSTVHSALVSFVQILMIASKQSQDETASINNHTQHRLQQKNTLRVYPILYWCFW
jgi:hypothetical protein